ncbi:hypothetical protein PT2222_70211 [Paraburkholderia tropica]
METHGALDGIDYLRSQDLRLLIETAIAH